ncbi:hypothetical protein [Burkholderia cenocepacia]|uniref:hypothetical protein n=1 Tax=Burkholderia cenocepacia TaxID=95486 RepID=UPI00406C5AB8
MKTWTDDQLADYETALETIGNVIAIASRDIAEEREKSQPDARLIDELFELQKQLNCERRNLRIEDKTAVRKAIEIYGRIVRSGELNWYPRERESRHRPIRNGLDHRSVTFVKEASLHAKPNRA